MPTNVRTDNKDLVTQHARGTVLQPADPVLLKPKSDPGVAPHFNISTTIKNPAGTVFDHGTHVAHSESYMGQGKHAPIVVKGTITGKLDGDNGFLAWAKSVYIEGRNAVMHGVETAVNAAWDYLPKGVQTAVENASQIAGGMSAKNFKDAAKEDAEAMLAALKSTDTLIALVQTAALMGISCIPVVGQLAGGTAAVMRLKSTIENVGNAADELKAMVERWSHPMTPAQLEEERKKLASWMIRGGIGMALAALGKAMPKIAARAKGDKNSSKEVQVGTGHGTKKTLCACSTNRPVIIATGEKTLTDSDFVLPGAIPLEWTRKYRSGDVRTGWFGQGWSLPLSVELRLAADAVTYHDAGGRAVRLPALAVGAEHFDAYEQFTLRRPDQHTWEIVFKDGRSEQFHRVRDDLFVLPLMAIGDRNGNRIAFDYPPPPDDPFAPWRPQAIVDAAGRRLHLEWNARGLLTAALVCTDPAQPLQALATYHYSEAGDLVTHLDAAGARRTYEWRHHVLVAYTEPDGARYCAEYDEYSPFGRVVRSYAAADGRGQTFAYDDRRRTTRITDALGRTTCYEYDERRDIVAITGPDGVRMETPFDANGHPRGTTDPLGRQSYFRFDRRGNLVEQVDAAGSRTALEYNALDLPIKITDALNHAWLREYDSLGNLTAVIDPLGQGTRYEYDARGRTIVIVDARGGKKHLDWDAAGNLAGYTDCSSRAIRFAYDALGRLLSQTDAQGHHTEYAWDAAGRLLQMTEPGGAVHRYQWSPQGRLLAYTDPLGAISRYRYNAHGDPIERLDANGHRLRYEYDAAGRLTALVNENGEATRFHYDLADRLTDEIGFDGRHQRYCYNAADELTHLVEAGGSEFGPGKVTRFERDALGRLTARIAEADATCQARYVYDKLGRLIQATNPAADIAFAYDPLGQVLSETQTLAGGTPRVLAHRYDALGNRIQTTLPDERVLHWLFYGSGHLHQVNLEQQGQHRIIADIERDALHREVARSQGALTSRYEYDPMGRLTRHQASRAGLPSGRAQGIERSYQYDAAGNLTARQDVVRGATHYRYDPAGRILAAEGMVKETFAFDPAGNLLPAGSTTSKVRGNRLTVYQDVRYDYDGHGNVTQRRKGAHEEARLTWNADHQLLEATVTRHGTTQTTRYAYDALGRRVRKSDAFGSTVYLWDGDLMIEGRRGNKANLYLFEPHSFVPLATVQDDRIYWYQCDQIGAPLELTDESGRIVWAADYKVWGEVQLRKTGTDDGGHRWQIAQKSQSTVEQPFRLQGQQFDEETGLHYNRFRYYDPGVGRFVSQDPIGLNGGFNLFLFVNNPLSWIDPLGLTGTTIDGVGNVVPTNAYGIPDKQQFEPKPGIQKYKRNSRCGPTAQQTASVQGKPCVVCGTIDPKMVADHKDALVVEHYRTGTNDVTHQTSTAAVQPHCPACSRSQGGQASAFSKCMGAKL